MSEDVDAAMAAAPAHASRNSRRDHILQFLAAHSQQAGLVLVIGALACVFQFWNSVFLSGPNVIEMLRAGALYFMVACPATMILVGGGLDFSIGAIYAVGGIVAGLLMLTGVPWPVAVLLAVAVGGGLGLVNGLVTIYLRVPPLIATLGMFFTAGGVITVATGGSNVFGFPPTFTYLGQGDLLGVPFLVYYGAITGIVFHILLEKTPFGYNTRILGGNRKAASANGVRVNRLDLQLYSLCGAIAALAGIMFAARTSSASPAAGGSALTFQVLTAIIIGGTSLFGGTGTIAGTALGALLFALVNNGLAVINVNALYQNVFIGIILVGAVAVDQARRQRQFASRAATAKS